MRLLGPTEASVTIVRDLSISGLAGDPRLERGDPFFEPWLLDAPELRLQLALDRGVVCVDRGHVADRLLGDDRQLTRARRGPARERLSLVDQLFFGDTAVHEADPLGL